MTKIALIFIAPVISLFLIVAVFDSRVVIRYKPTITTNVYDTQSRLIATLIPNHKHRIYIHFEDVPIKFIQLLIAIEDHDFFNHFGIRFSSIIRSIKTNLFSLSKSQGGSTITQQLVKNVALNSKKNWIRKIREIIAAVFVDTILSKKKILELYINEIYFGHGFYGFQTAAQGYFGKNLDQISLKEFTILLAIVRAPNKFNPIAAQQNNLNLANIYIDRFYKLGLIDLNQRQISRIKIPIILKPSFPRINKFPYVIDYLRKRLSDINHQYTTEIKDIYLTIDFNTQVLAKKELVQGANNVVYTDKNDFNGALITIKHETGEIIALVGGLDRKKSQFNRIFQMKRQIGSTIKPFIYLCALENNIKKSQPLINVPIRFYYQSESKKQVWIPRNIVPQFAKYTTFEQALIHSHNIATVELALNKVGLDKIRLCMKKYQWQGTIKYPAGVLGTIEMSPLEMVRLYSMFPNSENSQVLPYLIKKMKYISNETVSFPLRRVTAKINKKYRLIIEDLLYKVVKEGSAHRAQSKLLHLAAKTGTSDKNRDIWIAAFQKKLLTVVWLGNDSGAPIPDEEQTGGRMPAQIVKSFYEKLMAI
jgi:penicillin-binding protein 1A